MYETVEEKSVQITVEGKRPNKRLFWPVLVLIPTILLVLILGAAMGTIVGFRLGDLESPGSTLGDLLMDISTIKR